MLRKKKENGEVKDITSPRKEIKSLSELVEKSFPLLNDPDEKHEYPNIAFQKPAEIQPIEVPATNIVAETELTDSESESPENEFMVRHYSVRHKKSREKSMSLSILASKINEIKS